MVQPNKQRELFASAWLNLGNGIFLVLTFGQFISDELFDWWLFLFGLLLWFSCYWSANRIMSGGKQASATQKIKEKR